MLQSQARYAMVLFPVYFMLAEVGERRRYDEVLRAVSLAMFYLMTALFAGRFIVALA